MQGGQVANEGSLGLLGNRSVMDTPFNETSYTANLIQNQQARGLADLVVNDPSVRTNWENSYAPSFYIRGFSVSGWDVSMNGLFGIVLPHSASINNAERVEILHGPSAFLNGVAPQGSIGGIINIVPKRASDEHLASVTFNYVSNTQFGGQVDTGRRFGADKQFGIRFNGAYSKGNTPTVRQSLELTNGALALDYRNERVRLSADLGYQYQNNISSLRPVYLAVGVPVPRVPNNTSNWTQPWTYSTPSDPYSMVNGEVDLWKNWTAYGAAGVHLNKAFFEISNPSITDAAGDFTETFYDLPQYTLNDTEQGGVRGKITAGPVEQEISFSATRYHSGLTEEVNAATGGLATYSIKSNLYTPNFVPQPTFPALRWAQALETDLSSVALGDTLSILRDRVQLILGGRRQEVETNSFSTATGAVTSSYDKAAYTPAVGVVVKPLPNTSIYGNYIQGLQQGTIVAANYANANQIFPPYKSTQYEFGAKYDWGRFLTTLDLFQITQPSAIINATANTYLLNGEQRNRGIEFNTAGEVTKGVRLLGGVMGLDGKLTHTAAGTNDGHTAPNAPRAQINLGCEWDTPFLRGFTLTSRSIYTSSQYYDQANLQRIGGWGRFDAGARYQALIGGKSVAFRANAGNVLDRSYWSSAGTNGLSMGMPRTVSLSTTISF
jgi:iron complex outermembrane receptor protein